MSREIDAQVAERVMGLEVHYRPEEQYRRDDGTEATAPPVWWISGGALPPYSTDIRAAWEVAEKLRLSVEPWSATGWLAWQPPAQGWYCPAETAPMAICLAALEIVRRG